MNKRFVKIAAAVHAVLFLFLIVGCGENEPKSGGGSRDAPITFGIGTFSSAVDYAPLYIAEHFKWLKTENIEAEIFQFNQRSRLSDAVKQGTIDILFAAAPPVVITRAQGVDLQVFALSCTLRQEIAVQKQSAIGSISDLSGSRVAVLSGTSSHYGLLNSLAAADISPEQVEIVFQGPAIAEANFESGNIDAWAVWPPFIEKLVLADRARIIKGGDAVIQSVIGVSERFAAEHENALDEIGRVFVRAKQWMIENPLEAQAIVARKLQLDPQIIRLAWPKHDWGAVIDADVKRDIQEKIQFLDEQQLLRDGWKERIDGIWYESNESS